MSTMVLTQTFTETFVAESKQHLLLKNYEDKNLHVLGKVLQSYNESVVKRNQIKKGVDELCSSSDELKSRIDECETIFTPIPKKTVGVELKTLVSQIPYIFHQKVLKKVFGDKFKQLPFYTISDFEEAFTGGYSDWDSCFESEKQFDQARSNWQEVKEKIGWRGFEDLEMLKSLKNRTTTDSTVNISDLKDALESAKTEKWFRKSIIRKYERLVDMCSNF